MTIKIKATEGLFVYRKGNPVNTGHIQRIDGGVATVRWLSRSGGNAWLVPDGFPAGNVTNELVEDLVDFSTNRSLEV